MCTKERNIVKILDVRISKEDMSEPDNYQIMKLYTVGLLKDVMKAAQLVSCKDHRVRAS